ncbi:MAG: hypothetical protein JNL92_21120 [Opitutaceae bacterium]|nr:hypothetical protein [Opitutaceae bacterium]
MIMRNHFHLVVETPEPNLSEGMKWLQGTWAIRFNRYQQEGGRRFLPGLRAARRQRFHRRQATRG